MGFPLLLLVGLAGCPNEPAMPDGSTGSDGPIGATGLSVDWQSRPDQIPGVVEDGSRVSRAVFRVVDLRAVSDSGPVSIAAVNVEWAEGVVPAASVFPDAPPGLYSKLNFKLDPGSATYAYEITGTYASRPFTIRDRTATSLYLDYAIPLAPGGDVQIPVRVEIDDIIKDVDFDAVPLINGEYLIEDGTPQIGEVRASLKSAFGVHSS